MANGDGVPPPRPGGGMNGAKPPMKKSTRNWLVVGGLGAAAVVIYMVMRARSSAASTDPSIDPATGVPYSQETSGLGGASGVTPSLYGYVDPTTGAFISGAGAGNTVLQPSTNASWAQQVEAYLQTLGYDPIAVGAAIGKYLTGQTLSADQQGIVASALGFFGQPPQGAPPVSSVPPPGNGSGGGSTGFFKDLKVTKNETLGQFGKEHHWTNATLKAVEALMHMTASTKLHKGQFIVRPVAGPPTPQTQPMQ
jgi:hypothetical protein